MNISEGGWAVSRWDQPGFAEHVIVSATRVAQSVPVPAAVVSNHGDSRISTREVGGSKSPVMAGAPRAIMNRRDLSEALQSLLRECCA
ncbi:MAG: hypothetical protein OEN20_05455 [Gammaproteobacteria bacterium]|nr:hypothetical protein [Gammaproteobacteria bacterium]